MAEITGFNARDARDLLAMLDWWRKQGGKVYPNPKRGNKLRTYKPLIHFELDGALTTGEASNAADIIAQFGPGFDNPTTAITVYNLETTSSGVYVFSGIDTAAGWALWDSADKYRIIQMECP